MEFIKGLIWKKEIVAKFVVNGPINQKLQAITKFTQTYLNSTQKLMADVAKASKSKKKIVAVAVAINSPGGSAVQSALSGDKLENFARRKDVPIYTFAENVAASGGYWILCSGNHIHLNRFLGDKLYTNRSSIVGSIGVIVMLPNFRGLFDQTKINRLTITTSDKLIERKFDTLNKQEEFTEEDKQLVLDFMDETFDNFKGQVLRNRKDKIKLEDYEKVFNADVFLGEEALKYGLVDEIGDLDTVMKNKYPDASIVNFSKESPIESLKKRFSMGTSISNSNMLSALKTLQSFQNA